MPKGGAGLDGTPVRDRALPRRPGWVGQRLPWPTAALLILVAALALWFGLARLGTWLLG